MLIKSLILIVAVLPGFTTRGQNTICRDQDLGKIEFKKNSSKLSAIAKEKLDSLISVINSQQACEVLATSYSVDLCDQCGALSWNRQNAVKSYLMKKGVLEKRLRSTTLLEGNLDFVTLKFTSLPLSDQPSPYPNVRKKN